MESVRWRSPAKTQGFSSFSIRPGFPSEFLRKSIKFFSFCRSFTAAMWLASISTKVWLHFSFRRMNQWQSHFSKRNCWTGIEASSVKLSRSFMISSSNDRLGRTEKIPRWPEETRCEFNSNKDVVDNSSVESFKKPLVIEVWLFKTLIWSSYSGNLPAWITVNSIPTPLKYNFFLKLSKSLSRTEPEMSEPAW